MRYGDKVVCEVLFEVLYDEYKRHIVWSERGYDDDEREENGFRNFCYAELNKLFSFSEKALTEAEYKNIITESFEFICSVAEDRKDHGRYKAPFLFQIKNKEVVEKVDSFMKNSLDYIKELKEIKQIKSIRQRNNALNDIFKRWNEAITEVIKEYLPESMKVKSGIEKKDAK